MAFGGILFVFLFYGVTFAKYSYENFWNYYLKTKNFYLESDQLSIHEKDNVDTLWNGEKVYFNLKNSSDSDVSDADVKYEVKCSLVGNSSKTCLLNGTNSSTYQGVLSHDEGCVNESLDGIDVSNYDLATCETSGYVWRKNKIATDLYFEIDDPKDGESYEVKIEVTSTSPYKKKLVGNFLLTKDGTSSDVQGNYIDEGLKARYVLSNASKESKCIRLSWDSAMLHFDGVKEEVLRTSTDEFGYINEIYFNIKGKDALNFEFYKMKEEEIYPDIWQMEVLDAC